MVVNHGVNNVVMRLAHLDGNSCKTGLVYLVKKKSPEYQVPVEVFGSFGVSQTDVFC